MPKQWSEMTDGEKITLLRHLQVEKGWTRREIAQEFGTTRNALSGFTFRHREQIYNRTEAPKGQSPETADRGYNSDFFFIERYADRKARRIAANQPSAKLKGRPRAEWTWSPERKARFKVLWQRGALIKEIMEELGIGSRSAVSQAVRTLGLRPREQRNGPRKREVKVRLDPDELAHVRKMAVGGRGLVGRYIARLVRIDMGRAGQ